MTASKKLKTTTYWYDRDNPSITLLPGRHTAKQFAAAVKREGWHGDDPDEDSIKYDWFILTKKGARKSDVKNLKAVICTYQEW